MFLLYINLLGYKMFKLNQIRKTEFVCGRKLKTNKVCCNNRWIVFVGKAVSTRNISCFKSKPWKHRHSSGTAYNHPVTNFLFPHIYKL